MHLCTVGQARIDPGSGMSALVRRGSRPNGVLDQDVQKTPAQRRARLTGAGRPFGPQSTSPDHAHNPRNADVGVIWAATHTCMRST
jgi:hypothetical protein